MVEPVAIPGVDASTDSLSPTTCREGLSLPRRPAGRGTDRHARTTPSHRVFHNLALGAVRPGRHSSRIENISWHLSDSGRIAPYEVAVMVEAATDNVTRTVANVHLVFKVYGGSFGSSGGVAFIFQHMGVFRLSPERLDLEALELA